ncbi:YceI family protein [Robiginitalea sp. SC105]|uniref:YceI family protein n=1 Tax=Robiginitalea sp. SC105 TaxID=2762332 RepID=UPI00163A0215|nr:YceI family protein [Robiginitalea sp. SC105]MBC2839404.1 YceI family protein [Robiginitalea sp. SC105]
MKKFNFLILALLATLTLSAQSEWKADGAHSSVEFEIPHLMISTVTGTFGEFDISATAGDSFATPEFTATIQTTSVDTGVERRDNHLRSADFFEVETYPEMTFTTNSSTSTGEGTFDLTGDLTIHGVTKEVTFKGKVGGVITDQRSEKLKAGVRLETTIDRLEFGVGGETPTIGNELDITIRLEMAQQ